jgi:ATP-dependent Lon protease
VYLSAGDLTALLGPPRFLTPGRATRPAVGVAAALAWTESGGEVILVEAVAAIGQPGLTLTGQLGDVMRESAQAALAYVRATAPRLGIEPAFFERHTLHLHLPAGAVAKDGPSAGVAIAAALASAASGRPIPADIGMSGELTLRGQILAVGGVREKTLAAERAGLTTLYLPGLNRADADEIPAETRQHLTIYWPDQVAELLEAVLALPPTEAT